MFQILTLPKWECRAPAAFRRRNESYWCCAEIPINNEWVFVVNTSADAELQLPPRSILAVSTEKLLDVLADLGPEKVRSVYQLFRDISDAEGALMINRLRSIEVGEDAQDGWRKVFTFHTESGTPIADQRDISVVDRTTNRVEIARFTRVKVGPIDVANIKD